MKKKLLIVNNNMHIGGVQRALVNLLGCIHDQYDVTLLLFHPAGVLMEEIPADVRVCAYYLNNRDPARWREHPQGAADEALSGVVAYPPMADETADEEGGDAG